MKGGKFLARSAIHEFCVHGMSGFQRGHIQTGTTFCVDCLDKSSRTRLHLANLFGHPHSPPSLQSVICTATYKKEGVKI